MQAEKKQVVHCPYNKSHTFAKEKLMFHIARCKDKEKVKHLFKKCQYNPFHIVPKQELQTHECCCSDRQESVNLLKKLELNFRNSFGKSRERSREKPSNSSAREDKFEQTELAKLDHSDDQNTLQDCVQCQEILKKYKQKILQSSNKKLAKFIVKYYQLEKALQNS